MANKKNSLQKVWERLSNPTKTFIGIIASLLVFVGFFMVKDGVIALIEAKGWSPYMMIGMGGTVLIVVVLLGLYSAKKVRFY